MEISSVSLMMATSVNALNKAIDANAQALENIIEAVSSESSGEVDSGTSGNLDIYA